MWVRSHHLRNFGLAGLTSLSTGGRVTAIASKAHHSTPGQRQRRGRSHCQKCRGHAKAGFGVGLQGIITTSTHVSPVADPTYSKSRKYRQPRRLSGPKANVAPGPLATRQWVSMQEGMTMRRRPAATATGGSTQVRPKGLSANKLGRGRNQRRQEQQWRASQTQAKQALPSEKQEDQAFERIREFAKGLGFDIDPDNIKTHQDT